MKYTIATILFSLLFSIHIDAQKFGHLNSNEVLMALPEVKAADSKIEAYSQQLITKGQQMVKEYEAVYNSYVEKANRGELSQLQMQQEEAALTQQKQTIANYEREVQEMIAKKKQEEYQPILDKVQDIINQIGKENGYTMIFDSFSMGMVFADSSENLMPIVKERLGIQ